MSSVTIIWKYWYGVLISASAGASSNFPVNNESGGVNSVLTHFKGSFLLSCATTSARSSSWFISFAFIPCITARGTSSSSESSAPLALSGFFRLESGKLSSLESPSELLLCSSSPPSYLMSYSSPELSTYPSMSLLSPLISSIRFFNFLRAFKALFRTILKIRIEKNNLKTA